MEDEFAHGHVPCVLVEKCQNLHQPEPRHSIYAIFAYIGVVWGVNVGIYAIQ